MSMNWSVRRFSRLLALVLFAMVALVRPVCAQVEREQNAGQVAKAWFTSLMQGETAVTTSLSAVPFSFDEKRRIETLPDLKKLYDQVVENKGKRDLKVESVRVESSSPEKVVVILMVKGDDEAIAVTVKPGEAFRVVGFRD